MTLPRSHVEHAIVGAGLVGSLLAVFLKQQGKEVGVFEKRPDMRKSDVDGGRSINLVLTSRGIHALEQVGLQDEVFPITIPVYGRMMHAVDGRLTYQSYSKDNTECNYSVSRAELNAKMLSCAEREGVPVWFEHPLQSVDFEKCMLSFPSRDVGFRHLFGTDGAGSQVRQELVKRNQVTEKVEFLPYKYKELVIPAGPGNSYQIEKNALHIWPRGAHMLMALPNLDGSFTVTLYLAEEGENSFASLSSGKEVLRFFETFYPDAIPLIPDLERDFFANPAGLLGTVWSSPWHRNEQVVLLGDASHGIVPFFGQGMNSGFEDCTVLMESMRSTDSMASCFSTFSQVRKPDADAIASMALANFVEMRDHVGDADFLLQKKVESLLGRTFPEIYLSKYSMVTHSLIPYHIAEEVGRRQKSILETLCKEIEDVSQTDLEHAKQLIAQQLTPYLRSKQVSW